MNEPQLRALIEQVRTGTLPRRGFIRQLVGLGLSAPMASLLLLHEGLAQTPAPIPYKPTRRGGGGTLKLMSWQGPTMLNPHLAPGTKDASAGRIFYEPLAGWDSDGNRVPMLAAEIPTRANGGIAADGKSVTWKLKRGVTWHDGKPFTADDVVFTARYAADPATAAVSRAYFDQTQIEKLDSHTVRISSAEPRAVMTLMWVGSGGWILPRHVFEPYVGARSRECPANVKPVGTGPYRVLDFRPGDWLRAEANPNYHVPNQPFFDMLELKGGGEATTAARAVLQVGEYDFAANLAQVEDELLKRLETSGKGRLAIEDSGDVDSIWLNACDPWTEVEGERGHKSSRHPAFSDKAVRTAMALLVDRQGIVDFIVGRSGEVAANYVTSPPRLRSPNMKHEFNIDKANQVLEAAGWKKGADGVRARSGPNGSTKLKFVFQTGSSASRLKIQSVIKDACAKAGIALELKAVAPAVFFGGDASNPDTIDKFWADLQMYGSTMINPDAQVSLSSFRSDRVAQKANKWAGGNRLRYQNAEFDALHDALRMELDPVKRAALTIRLNDLVVGDGHVIPLYKRKRISGVANKLEPVLSAWDSDLWMLGYWTRGG